jgi:hypothetical protein
MPQSLPSLKPQTWQPASSLVALPFPFPGRTPKMQNVVGNGSSHVSNREAFTTTLKMVVVRSGLAANASLVYLRPSLDMTVGILAASSEQPANLSI